MRLHRHMFARISSVLLLAGAFVVMSAARADATLIVYVCNDGGCGGGLPDVTIADGSIFDLNLAPDSITYITAGGGTVTASTGLPAAPLLNLTYSLNAAAFASFGGTPSIYAAQDGYTLSPGNAAFDANASNGGGLASLFAGPGTFAPPGAAIFSCALDCVPSNTALPPGSPYFLAVGISPTPGSGGAASGDATVIVSPTQTTVPDGGSTAALLGSVLLGFGMLRRKFKQ